MATVCLSMIVKNEAHVIERCLAALRPLVDFWVIVDTGSIDGTQQVVRDFMAGVPGELHERPWVNFGHNRSEALALARPHGDYTLVFDADDVLEVPNAFVWPTFGADAIDLTHRLGTTSHRRTTLVCNRLPWMYRDVLHEYLDAPGCTPTRAFVDSPEIRVTFDGARSRGISREEKYARDARTLEAALAAEPDNVRYQYYLARSYRDGNQPTKALEAFRRRAEMGGWDEEVANSLFEVGLQLQRLGADAGLVIDAYLRSWEARPTRAEPLVALAEFARIQGRFTLGLWVANQAVSTPRPTGDMLWIDEEVYRWRSLYEYAACSCLAGDLPGAAEHFRRLLACDALPEMMRTQIAGNLALVEKQLGVIVSPRQPGLAEQPVV